MLYIDEDTVLPAGLIMLALVFIIAIPIAIFVENGQRQKCESINGKWISRESLCIDKKSIKTLDNNTNKDG